MLYIHITNLITELDNSKNNYESLKRNIPVDNHCILVEDLSLAKYTSWSLSNFSSLKLPQSVIKRQGEAQRAQTFRPCVFASILIKWTKPAFITANGILEISNPATEADAIKVPPSLFCSKIPPYKDKKEP